MPKIIQISKSEYFQGFHNGKYFFIMEILILYFFEKKRLLQKFRNFNN